MGTFSWGSEFLERFRLGDASALRDVYFLYVADVTRVARRFLCGRGPNADVDDVVQEVFAKAFSSSVRSAFDGSRLYGPYVGTLARNISINWALKRRRELVVDDIDSVCTEASQDPSASAAYAEALERLARFVARLPPELRRIHELRYEKGMTQRAVCAALGISRQELRTKETRLVAGLSREIHDECT